MPQIFSISGSFFGSSSWTNPAVWYGGVVPTASDQVFIRGVRTTVNFAAGYIPWNGVQTITVASTAGFPTSSSFFTYTDRDEEIKINYVTCSATQFISASIDTSFYSWSLDIFPLTQSLPSKKGGVIANGSFVQFRPGQILITSSMNISASNSASVPAITIENGGDLKMISGSTLSLNGYLQLNDGAFEASESVLIKWDKNFPSQSTETGILTNWTGISAGGQPLQKLIIRGTENRFNAFLTSASAIGDSFITVNNHSGFAAGDHIFVGEPYLTQSKGDNGFRTAFVSEVSSYDEVFEVAGVDTGSSRVYIQRMNGMSGIVKATASATELIVDEERFQVGDKVVINNQVRTITDVSSFDLLLKDYNFNSGSTLAEWETDLTRSFSFSDFTLFPGLGLTQFTTTAYRHLFVKDIMLDNVKVEAYVSNLRNITAGSGSRAEFGVHIQSEPQLDSDFGAPTSYNCPFRTSFAIEPANSRVFLRQKFYNNTNYNTIFTSSFSPDGPKKITLETSNGMVRGYLNDLPVFDEVMRAGNSWGRVGLYTNGNNCFVCTRFTVYAKYEKITLDSGVTVNIGDTVYETGAEYSHRVNDKVIKLASVVTNPREHRDLAFAYRGAEEYNYGVTGSFPYIYANNSASKNTDINNVSRLVNDYFFSYALGTANSRSVIIDFGQPVTFNNVGFNDVLTNILQNFTSSVNGGISFSGSNGITGSLLSPTASFWVPITGTLDGRFRTTSETYRSFTFPSQSFRFLRIETQGITRSNLSNTFSGYRVRLNVSNSLAVNNASDLGIGDQIFIFTKNNISSYRDLTSYLPVIQATSSLTTASFVDNFTQHYTIVNKSASVLYLDRPFEEGNIEAGALVVKMNRPLRFSGSFASGSGNWKVGKVAVTGGGTAYAVRRILIENASFQHLNVNYPYVGPGANQVFNGFALQDANWFNYMGLLQGCTFYNCYNYGGSPWWFGGRSGYATRNCVITNMLGVSLAGNAPSTTAPIVATGNIINVQTQTGSVNLSSTNVYSYNYVFGGDMALPSFTGYNALYTSPYAGAYIYERNYIAGAQSAVNYQQNIDNFGTSALLKVRFNKFEYWNGINGRFYINQFLDKGFDSPIILSKRGGLDWKRVHTANPGNVQYHSYVSSSYANNAIPSHYILGYIKNHNKQGYDIFPAYTGWWVKPQNSPYYRWYRHNTNANDWRNPILVAQIWVQPNVTASFNINFDYFVNQQIVWQLDGQHSGSLYMIAMKNGNELEPLANNILPKSTTPQNFNKTYQLSGSGHYYFALAGNATMGGYAAIANVSSRLIAPDTNDIQVLTNNFNLRYFNNEELTLAKTSYNQTPTDTKFRLQGARIF
jgi:hypothetical protein